MTPPFDRDAWEGKKPLVESQRDATGDDELLLDLIDVGFAVWGRGDDDPDKPPRKGGCVIEVRPTAGTVSYEVLHWPHGKPDFFIMWRDELDVSLIALPVPSILRSHARRLQAIAARKRGAVTPFELRCTSVALRLLEVIA